MGGINGRTREVAELTVPTFIYGTAWKGEVTETLVSDALRTGFRGIDTANQPKHYDEAAVGRALRDELSGGRVTRDELFLQTKFTFLSGQDHRLPYDPRAPIPHQVEQSCESSLSHLGVDVLDSYLLHAPSQPGALGEADLEAWRAMEKLHRSGKVRLIGVSNFSPNQLTTLLAYADVGPVFVQNRCFAALGWDAVVRDICERAGVVYQAFSLLTVNRAVVASRLVRQIAGRYGRQPAQVIFRFAQQLGMIPLTGTASARHMAEDLAVYDFDLSAQDLEAIESAAA